MLTPFGKALQKLRIDHEVKLKDLADYVLKTSSFLSAIEHGKKDASRELIAMIGQYFNLNDFDAEHLQRLSLSSQKAIRFHIDDLNENSKDMVAAFARKLTNLTPEQESSIISILDGE